jgi:hypothetical protein
MPYPSSPYGILITTLAESLSARCDEAGETVDWLHYSNLTPGESGQHGGIIFAVPRSIRDDDDVIEIIIKTTIWRADTATLLEDAGNAYDWIDTHLRRIRQGIRVTVGGQPYDLFKGWAFQQFYFPEDRINVDQGRAITMEWIYQWQTGGLLRNSWEGNL